MHSSTTALTALRASGCTTVARNGSCAGNAMRGKAWLAQKTIDAAVAETNKPGTRLPAGGFRVPGLPVVAVLGLLTCGFLMIAILSPLTLCLIGDVLVSIGVYALVRSRFVPGYDAPPSCPGPHTSRCRWPGDECRTTEELLGRKPVPPIGTIAALLGPDEEQDVRKNLFGG